MGVCAVKMSEKKKFIVSYGRTVQTRPYETMKIHLLVEHYVDEVPFDFAFTEARDKVEEWVEQEKNHS